MDAALVTVVELILMQIWNHEETNNFGLESRVFYHL